jgi:hypothetical protein
MSFKNVKRISNTSFVRPSETVNDSLQDPEKMAEKLKNYLEIDISFIPMNTHVRYITLKNGHPFFCLGGLLKRNEKDYVILSNGSVSWSVQKNHKIENADDYKTRFFKYTADKKE